MSIKCWKVAQVEGVYMTSQVFARLPPPPPHTPSVTPFKAQKGEEWFAIEHKLLSFSHKAVRQLMSRLQETHLLIFLSFVKARCQGGQAYIWRIDIDVFSCSSNMFLRRFLKYCQSLCSINCIYGDFETSLGLTFNWTSRILLNLCGSCVQWNNEPSLEFAFNSLHSRRILSNVGAYAQLIVSRDFETA